MGTRRVVPPDSGDERSRPWRRGVVPLILIGREGRIMSLMGGKNGLKRRNDLGGRIS